VRYERKDAHYRRAKAEGFRARSAYKLAELDDRHRLLRRGNRVVDLGAWPGGWIQVALDRIGPDGRVVAVDLVPLEPFPGRPVEIVVGDIADSAVVADLRRRLGDAADVVLSDAAPKLTGIRAADEARASDVTRAVVAALPTLLKPGGRALVKVFMDAGWSDVVAELRRLFATVRTTRPAAARRGSAEMYAVCDGYR
jgi:23S rRNA (uridine2552-2'-O)-methyltransferase